MFDQGVYVFFFFNDTATTEIYTLSLQRRSSDLGDQGPSHAAAIEALRDCHRRPSRDRDRKSTRLNSSHTVISYAVFCLKKKKKQNNYTKQNTKKTKTKK